MEKNNNLPLVALMLAAAIFAAYSYKTKNGPLFQSGPDSWLQNEPNWKPQPVPPAEPQQEARPQEPPQQPRLFRD